MQRTWTCEKKCLTKNLTSALDHRWRGAGRRWGQNLKLKFKFRFYPQLPVPPSLLHLFWSTRFLLRLDWNPKSNFHLRFYPLPPLVMGKYQIFVKKFPLQLLSPVLLFPMKKCTSHGELTLWIWIHTCPCPLLLSHSSQINENIDRRGSKISFRRSTGKHPASDCNSLLGGGGGLGGCVTANFQLLMLSPNLLKSQSLVGGGGVHDGQVCWHLVRVWGALKNFDTKIYTLNRVSASQIVSLRKLKKWTLMMENFESRSCAPFSWIA